MAKKSEKSVMLSSMVDARRLGCGGPPPENFWIRGPQMVHSNAFLGHCTPIPIPPPLIKKILFRFTLISRMVLGGGKKSEIRLKSEDSVPWAIQPMMTFDDI